MFVWDVRGVPRGLVVALCLGLGACRAAAPGGGAASVTGDAARASATSASALTIVADAVGPTATRRFAFDDLGATERPDDVALSPDGGQVALVAYRHFNYGDRHSQLWLVSTHDRRRRAVKAQTDDVDPVQPAWSADSRLLAYLVKRDKLQQVAVIRVEDGASVATPRFCGDGSAQAVSWSPSGSGSRLAVLCQAKPDEWPDEGDIIVASRSRLFHAAPLSKSPQSIVLFDAASGQASTLPLDQVKVTHHSKNKPRLVWHPSGQTLIFAGAPADDRDEMGTGKFVYAIDLASRAVRQVTREPLPVTDVDVSGDGREVILAANASIAAPPWFWRYPPFILQRAPLSGEGPLSTVTKTDVWNAPALALRWTHPSRRVFYGLFERASFRLYAFDPASEASTPITPADQHVAAYSASADGRTIAALMGDAGTPTELYLLHPDAPSTPPERLTRFAEEIRARHVVSEVSRRQWRSADNRFDVDGWLLKPPGCGAGTRCPLIVNVHGGPGVAWTNSFERIHFDDGGNQVPPESYAAHGYMVLMINPRGDMSYGPAYMQAILDGWEYPTRYDILAGVDDAIRRGEADPERLGIAGASYGGFVTTFAVTQTDRFKAGSANDPVVDLAVHAAFAYMGRNNGGNYYFNGNFFGGPQAARYPITDPRKIATPLLLRFGLNSGTPNRLSAFYASGLPLFVDLDARGLPVEMIVHPKDGHGIMSTDRIRDYNVRTLAWFDYWIKDAPYPDPERQQEFDEWKRAHPRPSLPRATRAGRAHSTGAP